MTYNSLYINHSVSQCETVGLLLTVLSRFPNIPRVQKIWINLGQTEYKYFYYLTEFITLFNLKVILGKANVLFFVSKAPFKINIMIIMKTKDI